MDAFPERFTSAKLPSVGVSSPCWEIDRTRLSDPHSIGTAVNTYLLGFTNTVGKVGIGAVPRAMILQQSLAPHESLGIKTSHERESQEESDGK